MLAGSMITDYRKTLTGFDSSEKKEFAIFLPALRPSQ